jgi:GntR family transcriptional regulator
MQQLKIDKTPLSLQARQYLLGLIEDGTLEPGEQLPAEADLATQLGISRPTLREALHNLEREGVIVRKHGVGTFVSRRALVFESGLEVLESLDRQAQRLGLDTEVVQLTVSERTATEGEREMLRLADDEPGEQFAGSVLDVLLHLDGVSPVVSRTQIGAEEADAQLAARLGVPKGTALLKLVGQLYGCDEKVLDYSISYFIPGHFKFYVTRRVNT